MLVILRGIRVKPLIIILFIIFPILFSLFFHYTEGYTCGKCGKIFTSLSYLARHIKRVCPDMSCRKWKCTMCDKAFRHPFGLQQHIYTHTGERPHKCSQCPKAFYSSNDLRRHSRIHSGDFLLQLTFNFFSLYSNSRYCLSCSYYDVSLENLD